MDRVVKIPSSFITTHLLNFNFETPPRDNRCDTILIFKNNSITTFNTILLIMQLWGHDGCVGTCYHNTHWAKQMSRFFPSVTVWCIEAPVSEQVNMNATVQKPTASQSLQSLALSAPWWRDTACHGLRVGPLFLMYWYIFLHNAQLGYTLYVKHSSSQEITLILICQNKSSL